MEFYDNAASSDQAASRFQFPTGWNSTKRQLFHSNTFLVSIPNGMEFYSKRSYAIAGDFVSIPNGMEFYFNRSELGAI